MAADLDKLIGEWAEAKIRPIGADLSHKGQLGRIGKEFGELEEKILLGEVSGHPLSQLEIQKELADICITCFTSNYFWYPGSSLEEVILQKLAVLWKREWFVDKDGHGQHVPGT